MFGDNTVSQIGDDQLRRFFGLKPPKWMIICYKGSQLLPNPTATFDTTASEIMKSS